MTPQQEDFALRSCHPLYREWCNEDDEPREEVDEQAIAEEKYEWMYGEGR